MNSIYNGTIKKILYELDKGVTIYTKIVKPSTCNASLYRSGDFYILEKHKSCGNALFSKNQLILMLENGTLDLMVTRRKSDDNNKCKVIKITSKKEI